MPRPRSAIPGRDGPAFEQYAPPAMLPGIMPFMHKKSRRRNRFNSFEAGGDNAQRIRYNHAMDMFRPCHRRSPGAFGMPVYPRGFPPFSNPWRRPVVGGPCAMPFGGGRMPPWSPFARTQHPIMRPHFGGFGGMRPGSSRHGYGHHGVRNRFNQLPIGRMGGGFPLGGMGLRARRSPPLMRPRRSVWDEDEDDEFGDDSTRLGSYDTYDRYSSHPSSVFGGDVSDDDEYYSDDEDDDYIWDESGSSYSRYGAFPSRF